MEKEKSIDNDKAERTAKKEIAEKYSRFHYQFIMSRL